MARRARSALVIDVLVEAEPWTAVEDAEGVVRRAVGEAAAALAAPGGELAIVLTDDAAVRALNRTWRGIDTPTNVLSFPTAGGGELVLLGDIVLGYETIAQEARVARKPFAHHLTHLAVHGFLHLLSYDHTDEESAAIMERIERDVLHRLGVPDPYRHEADA